MTRTLGLLVLLLGGSALLFSGERIARAGTASPRARFLHPVEDARGCKPRAPIAVSLEQTDVSDDGVVELAFSVTPRASLGPLSWRLSLPEGAVTLEGETHGDLAAGAPGTGLRHARVRLPAGADFLRVALLADSELSGEGTEPASGASASPPLRAAGGAGPHEALRSSAALSWGRPPAVVPARRLLDVAGGASVSVACVPATHRSGR